MKRLSVGLLLLAVAVGAAGFAGVAKADPIEIPPLIFIDVSVSSGPNNTAAPATADVYGGNAIQARKDGATSAGTGPGRYEQLMGTAAQKDFIASSDFFSWRGFANPGSVFGADYATQFGNMPWYTTVVNGLGLVLVSLDKLGIDVSSTDPGNTFAFSRPAGTCVSYDALHVGVDFGPNGVLGGGDDIYRTSGSCSLEVNALFTVDFGVGLSASCVLCDTAAQQAALDAAANSVEDGTTIFVTAIYSPSPDAIVPAFTAVVLTQAVPAPGTGSLLIIGFLGLLGLNAQRRKLVRN